MDFDGSLSALRLAGIGEGQPKLSLLGLVFRMAAPILVNRNGRKRQDGGESQIAEFAP
ncbi:hypothetical protein [Trichloromonas acetexigens]|uniref:hypothetical protein n=1 Tax=Trichloromonas acetexigens TaxID=38815 RepID=UPI001478C96F|nr:hypothetical protein [Desulfuromonas acetexigens]